MKKTKKPTQNRELVIVTLCLVAVVFLSSLLGGIVERRAEMLVAWDQNSPAAPADQSLSFDFLARLHLGNPFWFLK
jgi:hypothetical protein